MRLDEVFQQGLVLESAALIGLLERIEISLKEGLPEVAHVGHVHEHETGLVPHGLAAEGPEQVGLAPAAAPDDHPAQWRTGLGMILHGLEFGNELGAEVGVQVGDVPGRIVPDLREPHRPVEINRPHRIEFVHDTGPPR